MSADHNIPPGGGQGSAARFNAHFAQMNINAQPFVPNVQAQQFVPMGGGMHHGYPYGGYPMHGECESVYVCISLVPRPGRRRKKGLDIGVALYPRPREEGEKAYSCLQHPRFSWGSWHMRVQ